MSRCLDAGWRSPKPACTCGAGEDAPGTAHYSVRFPYSTTREQWALGRCGIFIEPNASAVVRKTHLWPDRLSDEDCPLYLWHRGCDVADARPTGYQCPVKSCGKIFIYCRAHGGGKRAEAECREHVEAHRGA